MKYLIWLIVCITLSFLIHPTFLASSMEGNVTLNSPDDNYWTSDGNDSVLFTYKFVSSDKKEALCKLVFNTTDTLSDTPVLNDTESVLYNSHDFSQGEYTWQIECKNGTIIRSEERLMHVDRTDPVVNLISPENGSTVPSGTIDFSFNYTDLYSETASCSLRVNDFLKDTNTSVGNGVETTLSTALGERYYNWKINCEDEAGNSGISEIWFLDVELSDPGTPIEITIIEPEDIAYDDKDDIPLTVEITRAADWIGYSLDGYPNRTITGNTTFDVGLEGDHTIEVYANDSTGNMDYDSVQFAVRLEHGIDVESPDTDTISTNRVLVNITTDMDSQVCMVSIDGDDNETMDNESASSWIYELEGLSEGDHHVLIWCNDSAGYLINSSFSFTVFLSGFNLEITSPANTTYWNETGHDIRVTLAKNASTCEFYIDAEGPVLMHDTNPRSWYYSITSIPSGTYNLYIICNNSIGLSNSSMVTFTMENNECKTSTTGLCTGIQECKNGQCENIVCGYCSRAVNHACDPYECCKNDECLDSQKCLNYNCVDITCACGEINNHTCNAYDCCTNFDCDTKQYCDTQNHVCSDNVLIILAPEFILAGEEFTITLINDDGDAIEGASVTILLPSGTTDSGETDEVGKVKFMLLEAGDIKIIADKGGYVEKTLETQVVAGFDWTLVIIVIIILVIAGGIFFYWTQLPELTLEKIIAGQNVTIRIKNNSQEFLQSVIISDYVPSRALLASSIPPRIETFGDRDHLTWQAALNPGEEIAINYQAISTPEKFSVKVGEKEYDSGYGFSSIIKEIIKKITAIFSKNENPMITGE